MKTRLIPAILALLLTSITATVAVADHSGYRGPTVLDTLVRTNGAEALVAAVLVVDEADVLDFDLADLLDKRRARVALFAPTNDAFEALLGLPAGFLKGLSIQDIAAALPDVINNLGLGAGDVAAILLKHAVVSKYADRLTETSLLRLGEVKVADGSKFEISVDGTGVKVNDETTIIKADVRARNGIIHFINTVIVDAP
jgi:uncharacterized surface protein with fasciclin (FAS1) repeats